MNNVLLITIDSLRADHVGCFGYDRNTTPNIDSLAADGVVFENAFAHACSTRPSFPSILTSAYALMYGGYEQVSDQQTVLAEPFDDEGYDTAGFHSNLYIGADFGYDRGFDEFYDSKTDPDALARLRQAVKDRLDDDGVVYKTLASAFDIAERQAGANIGSAYVKADEITDLALDWATERSGGDPKFLWVHYMDVHHPYVPPARHQKAFRDDPIDERRAIKLRRKMLEDPEEVTDKEYDDIIDLYDAEIRFTDAEIRRLVDGIRESWGETTIAVTADHGEEFREHGAFSHHATFHDEVIHVPLVFDDGEHEGRYDEFVGLLDIGPTLVDDAGLDVPRNFHGSSVRPLLDGEQWTRDSVIGDWENDAGEKRFYYRNDDWKYIRRTEDEYLYDLHADPGETTNVLDDHPDVADSLGDEIDAHERAVEETAVDYDAVEMDEDVKERLRDLGYKE